MIFQCSKKLLLLAVGTTLGLGCGYDVQAGEDVPQARPAPKSITGLVFAADSLEGVGGAAFFLSPQDEGGEVLGAIPDGSCRKGRHNVTLKDKTTIYPHGYRSVGSKLTLSAPGESIPLPKIIGAAGEVPVYYRFSQTRRLTAPVYKVSWEGSSDYGDVRTPFEGDLLEFAQPPSVTGTVLPLNVGEPYTVRWGGQAADFVIVSIFKSTDYENSIFTCTFRDTGLEVIPESITSQLDPTYDKLEIARAKTRVLVMAEEKTPVIGDYGVMGMTFRAETVSLQVKPKRVFVTSTKFPGDLKTAAGAVSGLAGADTLCNMAATNAGLGGTWRAWLSDDGVDALSRIADVGPWYLVNGTTRVFANKDAMDNDPLAPINISEFGTVVAPAWVWTGTDSYGKRRIGDTCLGWTTESSSRWGQAGHSDQSTYSWTQYSTPSCYQLARLYCIEQ